MGGAGSGNWYRWDKRTTLDDVKRLDIRWLYRQGYLRPWASGMVTWHRGERHTEEILVQSQQDSLVFHYRYRAGGEAWEPVQQTIPLVWTSCHYGGTRPWGSRRYCRKIYGKRSSWPSVTVNARPLASHPPPL